MKAIYDNHIKTFLEYSSGSDPTFSLALAFRKHLQRSFANHGTKRVKWAAMLDYYWTETRFCPEELVKELEWIAYQVPFSGKAPAPAYRLNDYEVERLLDGASDKDRCLIKVLRTLQLRVSEALELRPDDSRIPDELREECLTVMGPGAWLLHTESGRQYDRSYVSERIRTLADRILGKKCSAESLRTEDSLVAR